MARKNNRTGGSFTPDSIDKQLKKLQRELQRKNADQGKDRDNGK